MGKSLVIVESPAKAKTINKYLGNQFIVKSSVGHIRDLPTSGSASPSDPKARAKQAALTRKMTPKAKAIYKVKKAKTQLVARMGIDPNNDWAAQYQTLPGKEKVVEELKRLAKDADTIYLATDLDREGEAIAWHLRETIGGDNARYSRVVFNEITKKAIQEAFDKPTVLDINHVNAQQARRFLDRVVGYMLSPLLWEKVARGLSAGRVQSVSVKLVVDREKEIRAFIPDEFWEMHAKTVSDAVGEISFQVAKYKNANYRPTNQADALAHKNILQGSEFKVVKREDRNTSSKAAAPFITSTLQQSASTRLGFGVKKTMMMAQRLYEAGYITYMRTDSTNLSADAVATCRGYILDNFGQQYLPDEAKNYSSKEGAQEAHEAIRPSDVTIQATALIAMERDAERLYELIRRRFLACQMMPALYTSSRITVQADAFELQTKGRILRFDGYTRVMMSKDEDVILPDVKSGEVLSLISLDTKQHFTKPTARFTEASLVKELEKKGIGRPSTYASIISTIQDRGYVEQQNKRFYACKMGDIVVERLTENFADLMDYSFTARMESALDDVAKGSKEWKALLDEFYLEFTQKLEVASGEDGMRQNEPTLTDIECVGCARPMTIRTGTTGVFLGCSGYALPPKERCKETLNLTSGDEVVSIDGDDEEESRILLNKHRCQICDSAMDSYLIDSARKLHVCGNNPDCSGFEVEKGEYRIKGYEGPVLDCDKCENQMQLKTGRFGKFFGCTNEGCKNTRKLLRNGEAAPPKMDPVPMPELECEKVEDTYILRDGAAGLFLAASKFPRNRETRAPKVLEILAHQAAIDTKYEFLFSAPTHDNLGNEAVIRYSRKTKEQYVMTEIDGKASGWKAFYSGTKWEIDVPKPKPKASKVAKGKVKKSPEREKL